MRMALNSTKPTSFDFNTLAAKEWRDDVKGLRKELVDFNFKSMKKASEISRCLVRISEVQNLNDRESNYLQASGDLWIVQGSAVTPIDCYIETFLRKMFEGETSRCCIQTRSSEEVSFIVHLLEIDFRGYLFQLTVPKMYELAQKYRENGVAMFKKYPIFAQDYFSRAAKCLISYKPFENLTQKDDQMDGCEMENLLRTINTNLAACLIKEGRFEDVLHVTAFVDSEVEPTEKAIYRRAVAYHKLKKFQEAKDLINNSRFKSKAEFSALYGRISKDWQIEEDQYKNVMRKMFS